MKVKIVLLSIALGLGTFWLIYPYVHMKIYNDPYRVQYSPDKEYRLEYYNVPFTPFGFPHALIPIAFSEYYPGYVLLVDNTDDNTMGGEFYEMRIEIDSTRWHKKSVSIIGFYRWDLR